jgi:GTPase SAR1 family protein
VAQYDQEYFKKQFGGLPSKATAIIASRAAMRVLPMLAHRGRDAGVFAYWKEGERDRYALAIIRCYQASAFVNSLTKADRAAYAGPLALAASAAHAASADARTPADAAAAAPTARAAAYAAARAAARTARADADAAARTARAAAYAAARESATARATRAALAAAISRDVAQLRSADLLASPLWGEETPPEVASLWLRLQRDLRSLEAGFEVWIDWYQDRLDGKPFDWEIERQWATLSNEQFSQSPAEINAYLKALRDGALTKQLRRVRAIFIGHGEVGKTSLIRALHGEDVIAGKEATTPGVAIKKSIHERAGVFKRVTDYKDDDLTVYFWDFGGQIIAYSTHQFFLRSQCLYVIVLAGRAERNPNEEAEYWLEHVRAFGDSAPVLLVGNKADVREVNLDLWALKNKFPNIVGFYPLSCTQAKGAFRKRFEVFREEFSSNLKALAEQAERFHLRNSWY